MVSVSDGGVIRRRCPPTLTASATAVITSPSVQLLVRWARAAAMVVDTTAMVAVGRRDSMVSFITYFHDVMYMQVYTFQV